MLKLSCASIFGCCADSACCSYSLHTAVAADDGNGSQYHLAKEYVAKREREKKIFIEKWAKWPTLLSKNTFRNIVALFWLLPYHKDNTQLFIIRARLLLGRNIQLKYSSLSLSLFFFSCHNNAIENLHTNHTHRYQQ